MCVLIASLLGMGIMLVYSVDTFNNDAFTVNIDTNYLQWNNTFPAISFCMQKPLDVISEVKIRNFIIEYYEKHNIENPFK